MSDSAAMSIARVLSSGHIAQGPVVDDFELKLATAMSLAPGQRVVTVNSGTSAIHLALVLAGVKPGDRVAVSPMTCAASIVPILHLGAHPLWIDVDPKTGLMDPASLQWRLTSDTTAIIAIDWAGVPCDYGALHAAANGIPIIQDAAHALFARDVAGIGIGLLPDAYKNHYVCHSFQAIKHLTTGDGGCLIVPREQDDLARRLRWFGFDRTISKDFRCAQELEVAGYKFQMNDVAAAMGVANITEAIWSLYRARAHAKLYCDAFAECRPSRVTAPAWVPGASWWLYTLLVDDRPAFQEFMRDRGIETSQVHRRNDEHPVFQRALKNQVYRPLAGLDLFAKHQVSIPVHCGLIPHEVQQIIAAVSEYASMDGQ